MALMLFAMGSGVGNVFFSRGTSLLLRHRALQLRNLPSRICSSCLGSFAVFRALFGKAAPQSVYPVSYVIMLCAQRGCSPIWCLDGFRSRRTEPCARGSRQRMRLGSQAAVEGRRVIHRRAFIAAALASCALPVYVAESPRSLFGPQSTAEVGHCWHRSCRYIRRRDRMQLRRRLSKPCECWRRAARM